MISAHEKIVHHLITTVSIPDRVDHVKVLVSELQRISILWDELWFNSIQQYSTEVAKRVKKMEDEAEKLKKNDTLRFVKYLVAKRPKTLLTFAYTVESRFKKDFVNDRNLS